MMSKTREEAVWKRVMELSAQAPEPRTEPENGLTQARVLELLCGELASACTYRTLAARAGGQVRKCLQQLAREELQHARHLETVYYLMTGRKPCPDRPKPPCVACLNEELRRRYEQEIAGAARYHGLAERAGSFSCLMHAMAREEEGHGRRILQLLELCL